jgi:hypothetical protein
LTAERFRIHALLERLVEADIRFVLVGGLAVGAWGYVRGTKDLDVVPDPAGDNLERLAELLRELDGKVEVEDGSLTADAISIFLRTGDRTLGRHRGIACPRLLPGSSAGDEANK